MKTYKGILTAVLLAAVLIGIGLCTEEFNKRCNHITSMHYRIWLQEYNQITPVLKEVQYILLVNTE